MKVWLLRFHRWVALTFSLPLLLVIGSGLFLSLEPALKASVPAGTVTLERLSAIATAAGPDAARGALFIRGYDGTAAMGPRGAMVSYELASASPASPGLLAASFGTMRRFHETLLLDLGPLVTASTIAMVILAPLGLLLGWPRLRNTLSGWHKATGWFLIPLVVGSPLTGVALAFGISFTPPMPRTQGSAPPLDIILRQVAAQHDLNGLDFVRPIGGARLVRVLDSSGTAVIYRAEADGLRRMPTGWPRVLHEGNWGGLIGSVLNVIASIAMLGLLVTGFLIWGRRHLVKRRNRAARLARAG
ncbi:PepSY domain-containing protein [Rhodovarius crocodyli]|uniref:PepSY domain-containing protein n=1 Tax=Rhodovarius crocodyli TaxID=1979269 RepID=A0A437MN34_9PROT|nr:PepSY-associated TM helix domain-containing protein [Rhodovarius crocodyli]RVT99049.1 PepSY domain-containing protein [Rhodovarius crocodyli]